ncbi:MAG: ketoacyl-ACP synthase III [Tidjanibacter sp.]|nr:ketoacyl-ACP synthase III [Tidjanibacter sp.]
MKIIGTGRAHPAFTLTNSMLEEILDTSNDWIVERTGITQRQIITNEKLEDLAAEAARKALDDAGLSPRDIDLLICSNVVNEYATPSLGCVVEGLIGAECPTYDINAACSGFVYALSMAEAYLCSGMFHRILVLCAEEPTRMVSWQDRSTCVLFGDAAGAVVVTAGDELKAIRITATPKRDVLRYERMLQPTPYITKDENDVPLVMNGREVFKTAVTSSIADVEGVLRDAGVDKDEVKYYILHQANVRIIDAIREHFKQPVEKFPRNVDRFGNTSSASIPVMLDEMSHQGCFKRGDKLVLSAFGAGFTTAACVIEWAK